MTQYIVLGLVCLGVAGTAVGYWQGIKHGKEQQLSVQLDYLRGQNKAQSEAVEAIHEIRKESKEAIKQFSRQVKNIKIYSDCKHADAERLYVNEALTGKRPSSD